eukprot:9434783-Ditylum_brightwellii.AAC.1
MAVVDEVDFKERVLDLQYSDSDLCALGNDGDDGGLAPLQTVQPPDVEFEALDHLKKPADKLKENGNDANGNEGNINPLTYGFLSPGGTTAAYHQENVLPTEDFVNMDTT